MPIVTPGVFHKRGGAVMPQQDESVVRTVAWSELFPWLRILGCFRVAISARALVLGATGVLLTLLGWWVIVHTFYTPPKAGDPPAANAAMESPYEFQRAHALCPTNIINEAVPSAPAWAEMSPGAAAGKAWGDPLVGTWTQLGQPFWQLLTSHTIRIRDFVCLVLAALWALAVWAFFGGAISRMAAVKLAADEQVGLAAAVRFARSKWSSYFTAPMFPLMGVVLATLPVLVLALLMRTDVGLAIIGIFWPLQLVWGLFITVLLLGLVFGWPLMWGTISTEGSDSFDALSRCYAYVFQRPLRLLGYVLVATVLGILGWLLVKNFAAATIWFTYWAASWGAGDKRITAITDGSLHGLGVKAIHFWCDCLKLLAMGFVYSYFWSAASAIYLLLRRDVDATELDEVFLDADESEQSYALPPLTTPAAAVPSTVAVAAQGSNAAASSVVADVSAKGDGKPAE
jgi:hypothetical protein